MRKTINIDCKHIWNAIQRLREADVNNINIVENEIARVMSEYGVEQKHGHWKIIDKDVTGCIKYECSHCGKTDEDYSEPIFCKHCGYANGIAKVMDEATE